MDITLRSVLRERILSTPGHENTVLDITIGTDGAGIVSYNLANVWLDPSAPGFNAGSTALTDEEIVRAYLLVRLSEGLGYEADPGRLEIEHVYKPVGRPLGKGGRVDVLVRGAASDVESSDAFLFIECKAPSKFDADLKMIDGQLFRLSRQEPVLPKYLVYYTVELRDGSPFERLILIDTDAFPTFESWDAAGQPITDVLPESYGIASKRRYGNVPAASDSLSPLDEEAGEDQFSRLQTELHDVVWGGGGTNNNEVFVVITRLLLAKIFDEKETSPGDAYAFQRLGTAVHPESPAKLVQRLNALYKLAEDAYLALPKPSSGPAFDEARIAPEKIAYVVGRLESISVTENKHPGDILGDFFEGIIGQDFTQSKGQFFTPYKIVQFMLAMSDAVESAVETMRTSRDHLGRPRLPYVIDPSCGSGTFLIEYMKEIRAALTQPSVTDQLPARIKESHTTWFSGRAGNAWARDHLFGVENNYDLGLAAKVNMVLHGDGSMNTWISSGLLPFSHYEVDGRHNTLGSVRAAEDHPYRASRNEQFDLVISNPPFSIRLSPDEKKLIQTSFDVMRSGASEAIFIERWYQLLREGGRFISVLPEAVLDTSTGLGMREFLLKYFRMEAVVSLPYDAFRPFTSTKTAIVLATKRPVAEVRAFEKELELQRKLSPSAAAHTHFSATFAALEWNEPIFMAEPSSVGYKRRKGLSDVPTRNDLMAESDSQEQESVLSRFRRGYSDDHDAQLGFWTTLEAVASRPGLRLDPKYRWLWDFDGGVTLGSADRAVPLGSYLEIVALKKIAKGELTEERRLVDLELVEGRQGMITIEIPTVETIGSEKVSFDGADLIFSKLEPYLGKLIINPDPADIGSTEWVGLKIKGGVPRMLISYLLLDERLRDAYRRLQSGKRHARLDPKEMLELKVELPPAAEWDEINDYLAGERQKILNYRVEQVAVRDGIDVRLRTAIESG
ncbi:N-6 DNA methylase [Microbacterium lacticum]